MKHLIDLFWQIACLKGMDFSETDHSQRSRRVSAVRDKRGFRCNCTDGCLQRFANATISNSGGMQIAWLAFAPNVVSMRHNLTMALL